MQHTSFYTFSERLEFEALKPEKTALKKLNEKETEFENEEFEAIKRVIILAFYNFLSKVFANEPHYCQTRFYRKNFSMVSLMRNDQ